MPQDPCNRTCSMNHRRRWLPGSSCRRFRPCTPGIPIRRRCRRRRCRCCIHPHNRRPVLDRCNCHPHPSPQRQNCTPQRPYSRRPRMDRTLHLHLHPPSTLRRSRIPFLGKCTPQRPSPLLRNCNSQGPHNQPLQTDRIRHRHQHPRGIPTHSCIRQARTSTNRHLNWPPDRSCKHLQRCIPVHQHQIQTWPIARQMDCLRGSTAN